MTRRVGIKGQVVIPKAIREEIGIEPGDEVAFEADGAEVRVRRAADEPAAARIEQEWTSQGAAISAVNLGEAPYMAIQKSGEDHLPGRDCAL